MSSTYVEVGPIFVNEMFNEGKIPEATFSFGMMGFGDEEISFIDFGKPDEFRTESGTISDDSVVTFGFNDDYYWSTYTQAIKFSNNVYTENDAI